MRHFAGLGKSVEWKYYAHDEPADLPEHLTAAGFVPDDPETVMIGETSQLAIDAPPPASVTLREVTSRADLERVRAEKEEVWGGDHSYLPESLGRELADANAGGDPIVIVVAEAGDRVVCAAWVRFELGTDFASLWGGSTLPEWRGRGIYRSMVAYRARLALARGFRYLQVDASADSRPILTRLGLRPVAVTIPYRWYSTP